MPKHKMGYDKTRGNIALAKLGVALGVQLDSAKPDHELLESLAEAAQNTNAINAGAHRERVMQIVDLCNAILELRHSRPE